MTNLLSLNITECSTSSGVWSVIGSFAGAELFYKSDRNVHTAVFVDHLNTSPVKSSYTTWFNPRTGNNGDIKINRTYVIDSGMKCSDYISTMNITTQWIPLQVLIDQLSLAQRVNILTEYGRL